jgi:ATP-binding cassette subfamily B protein
MQTLTKQTLKIFWQHSKKYPWQIFFIVFGLVGHILTQNYGPILYKKLIDTLTTTHPENITPALKIIKTILYLAIFRFTFARTFNFINNWFQPRVMADLNNTCYQYLHKHSLNFFSSNFVGSLVTKVKRYERSFETVADQILFELGRNFLDVLVIITILFTQNAKIALFCCVWAIIYIIFSVLYSQYKLPIDLKRAQTDTLVTAQLADSITNNFNIKMFATYDLENQQFSRATEQQFLIRKKSWHLGTIGEMIQATTMILLEFVSMYYAVKYWQAGLITIGTVALLQAYFFRIFDKFWNLGRNIRNLYEAIADANEMTEILLKPHEITDSKSAKPLAVNQGEIKFNNLSFSYIKGVEVLKNFNLTIKPKEKMALIGPSGGGKSTIVKLLLRFYDLTSGQILIDKQNLAKVTQDSLREQIAFVPLQAPSCTA